MQIPIKSCVAFTASSAFAAPHVMEKLVYFLREMAGAARIGGRSRGGCSGLEDCAGQDVVDRDRSVAYLARHS